MNEDEHSLAPRKLTHAEARTEHLLYWQAKSAAERIEAAQALTRRMYLMRGIDIDDFKTDLTPRRVPRDARLRDLADVEELSLIPDPEEP